MWAAKGLKPIDVGNGTCVEVDFAEDLECAEDLIIKT